MFYLFSSEVSSGSGADQVVEYLPTMTSPNLTEWSVGRSVFDDISKPSFISGSKISCPDIAFVGGKYLLYYTLSSSSATGIGVAEADFASGPFTDKGALITSSASGLTGVASPSFVTDGTSNYLAFGSFGGIFVVRLSADGLSVEGTPVMIASDDFDAPCIVFKEGKFHLFVSSGSVTGVATSTSRIRYGRAERAEGPYLDRSMKDMLDDGGENLIGTSVKFSGPGHCSAISVSDGSVWLLYNAYDLSAVDRGRTLMLDRLEFNDGWASVRGGICSFSAAAPAI